MHRHLLIIVLATALVAGACGDDDADEASAAPTAADTESTTTRPPTTTTQVPTTSTEPPPPPAYDELGPYAVGRRTSLVVDSSRGDRALPVEVLYPAIDDGSEPTHYEFIPGLGYASQVALDAPPAAPVPDGVAGFPLIVYSHGNNGWGWVHADLTEHLASHGFVVVSPDHVGNTMVESFVGASADPDDIRVDRPLDISFVISSVLDGTLAALDEIGPIIDTERVGVVGHSAGGFSALAVVGGTATNAPDERVDAVVGLAAATGSLDDDVLTAVDVPTLLLSGTADVTTPIEANTERPAALIPGPLTRIDLVDAGHMSFSDICLFVDLLNDLPDVSEEIVALADSYAVEACVPELLDIEIAQDVVNHATTAFLLSEVAGDDAAGVGVSPAGIAEIAGDDIIHFGTEG